MTDVAGPQEQLVISTDVRDGVAFVTVTGEIDLESASAFVDPLLVLAAEGTDEFVLDVSGVTFIDSSGLSALVRLTKAGGGTRVRVTGMTDRFSELLRMTGLDAVLDIV